MAHKTLIGGTAYDITGGTTLIDGTAHSIASGKTLIEGTAQDISFAPPLPPVTVTVTGSGLYQGERWAHIFYRNIMYSEPTVIENVPYGADLSCTAAAKAGFPYPAIYRGTATILVNGEILKSEQTTSPSGIAVNYDHALESDVTVELSTTIGQNGAVSSTINIITT